MFFHENYFKPYRERVKQMNQFNDSLEEDQSSTHRRDQSLTKQPKLSYKGYYKQLSTSPIRRRVLSPESPQITTYNKTKKTNQSKRSIHEPIWEHLYHHGLQTQKQIIAEHQLRKDKIDIECTFQPLIRKNSKYLMPSSSTFFERNNIWYENKIEKIVKEKEEEVSKGLEDCTFKPKINNYKLKRNKSKSLTPSKSTKKLTKSQLEQKQMNSKSNDPDLNRQQVGRIKNLIRKELKRIQL